MADMWGTTADLVSLIDVQPDGRGGWVGGVHADEQRPVVEGSQLLGESIVAAMRETNGRRAVSASMLFTRVADAREPVTIVLDKVSDGRTMSSFATRAVQHDRLCATGVVLLDETAPDLIRHAEPAPDVAGPDDATPYDMGVVGRDLRIVDNAYTGDPDAPLGPPDLNAWVRFDELPDDPAIHAGLLAQFTGHLSIAAALRPHAGIGESQAHHTISTAINAIHLSLHAPIHADQWMLYHHHSTFAGDGMTYAECRVFDEAGALLASFSVDGMVRGFSDPTARAMQL